jgi:glycosyltransferase A (GT-A) superfamily protein (DUF2064 family)
VTSILVVAKAPEPGRVKTRLGADIGMEAAAEAAAASLLDTLEACAAASTDCHLSMAGDLDRALYADELRLALTGWTVHPQAGATFGHRLADAHARMPGPVVQVGMDTPHLTADLLAETEALLATYDAVLGPADDGGWWALALRDPAQAACLAAVPMSTPTAGTDTRIALERSGLTVGRARSLRDVDTAADADAVAALAPDTRFAGVWSGLRRRAVR